MSTYLVTGCAGFIGSRLTRNLLETGHRVIGVDALTDYYAPAAKRYNLAPLEASTSFRLVEADLSEADLGSLLEGCDGIYHLAAQPGVRGSWGDSFGVYVRDNVLATQRVFEAAVTAGRRVVYASSSSVYGNADRYPTTESTPCRPISPYGVTKRCCEELASAYADSRGLAAIGLRYFTVYGPGQRPDMAFSKLLEALLTGGSFRLAGTGEQSRDFTFVDDAVSATIAAMARGVPGSVYNVGGGAETTLNRVVEIAESLTGRRLAVVREPAATGDVQRTAAETSLLRTDTAWQPRVALRDGIAAQLADVMQRASAAAEGAPQVARGAGRSGRRRG